jgi:hypothetical protein
MNSKQIFFSVVIGLAVGVLGHLTAVQLMKKIEKNCDCEKA